MFALDLPIILFAWLTTFILQFISFPHILPRLKNYLYDAGWALGRTTSWLFIGLSIWFVGHLKIPINTNIGLYIILLLLIAGSIIAFRRHQKTIVKTIQTRKIFIAIEELLFLSGFVILSYIRTFNPKILDLEKFMDAGFMASYLRSSTLPAPDIWLAGETINYYSFGHFLGSVMTRFWHLPIALSYNLLLGLIMGLGLMLSFSFVVNLIFNSLNPKSIRPLVFGGIIGSLLVIVGGNTHTLWYWIKNKSWDGYWYADATRFIENTIHEFPSYSFVVSDLHAHVWSLPFVLSFLILIQVWTKSLFNKPKLILKLNLKQISFIRQKSHILKNIKNPPPYLFSACVLGIILGTFIMTSAWDFLIYGVFLVILGFLLAISFPAVILRVFLSALTMGIMALFIAAPWLLNFTSISEGIAFVTIRSPIWRLFVLWTNHSIFALIAIILVIFISTKVKKIHCQAALLITAAMVFTAWILLALPEIVYVKDIYSGHPRANTMFKLTYQAFILMSLVGGWVAGIFVSKKYLPRFVRFFGLSLVLILVIANLLFPYFSYRDYYGRLNDYQGLDGYTWLKEESPSDYNAIIWMQDNISGQPVILEAVGESYTKFDRVSAITGLPTVLGWRVHEWLWRGGFDIPGQRTEEVKTMFEQPLSTDAQNLYDQYQVEYIFVGDKEYEAYPDIQIFQLKSLGDIVFQDGDTLIIHRHQ